MGFWLYTAKRLVLLVPVLIGMTVVVFGMLRLIPGDPAFLYLGDRATEQAAAAVREQLGLNRPLWEQYWIFVSGIVSGNLGDSLHYRKPVAGLILDRMPATIFLTFYAAGLAALITLPVASLAALNRDRPADQVIRAAFLVALGTPNFWLGILLILGFAVNLRWFPVSGFGKGFQEHVWYLFLPALTLALHLAAVLIRNLRSQIIAVLSADYVRTARAKGLAGRQVLTRHVLRNALMSTLSIFGLQIGYLLSGTVVIETVFSIPGVGTLLVDGITARDYPIVQGVTLFSAVFVILITLITDLMYGVLDPRVTYG